MRKFKLGRGYVKPKLYPHHTEEEMNNIFQGILGRMSTRDIRLLEREIGSISLRNSDEEQRAFIQYMQSQPIQSQVIHQPMGINYIRKSILNLSTD